MGVLAAVLIGFGMGGEADVIPYLLSRYFGLRSFSTLYGLTWTVYACAGAHRSGADGQGVRRDRLVRGAARPARRRHARRRDADAAGRLATTDRQPLGARDGVAVAPRRRSIRGFPDSRDSRALRNPRNPRRSRGGETRRAVMMRPTRIMRVSSSRLFSSHRPPLRRRCCSGSAVARPPRVTVVDVVQRDDQFRARQSSNSQIRGSLTVPARSAQRDSDQNPTIRFRRAVRGSVAWKWTSSTPPTGSPGSRDV